MGWGCAEWRRRVVCYAQLFSFHLQFLTLNPVTIFCQSSMWKYLIQLINFTGTLLFFIPVSEQNYLYLSFQKVWVLLTGNKFATKKQIRYQVFQDAGNINCFNFWAVCFQKTQKNTLYTLHKPIVLYWQSVLTIHVSKNLH